MAEQWQPFQEGPAPPGPQDEWEIAPEGLRRRSPLAGAAPDSPAPSGPPPDGHRDAPTAVLVVSPSGAADCRSIREAVLPAPAGARIPARPGTYPAGAVLEHPAAA